MSAKSRGRMNAGIQPSRTQASTSRNTRLPQQLPGARRGSMLNKLTAAEPDEREAIREHLRDDGSPRARALLAELERRWEQS